ncbi:TetR/AcrR family transcriptional regulator [Novosphingobium flavum]|nr:TetR/AcrR family transcriptional regulator [Novosphingobium aerophilum]
MAPPLPLRERNKLRKEQLIREAARRLFMEKGYEATTLREIAEAADVGFGTVFSYAHDKAGLLAMVYVEELKALPPLFGRTSNGEVLDQLIGGLTHLYRFWGKAPSLGIHVLKQMEFYTDTPHMQTILARRAHARGEVRDWLRRLEASGDIPAGQDLENAADTLFAIYTSAVRDWMVTPRRSLKDGLARLRSLMELAVRGLIAPR